MPTRLPCRLAPCLIALVAMGCDGPTSLAQKLTGDWVGRPETIAERTVREWPTATVDEDDPLLVEALADAKPTDLEAATDVRVQMRLGDAGEAKLTLGGTRPITGEWSVTPIDGRRGLLEITPAADGEEGETSPRRHRYEVEFLPEGGSFVLREQGADGRFGRLLFERSGTEPVDP